VFFSQKRVWVTPKIFFFQKGDAAPKSLRSTDIGIIQTKNKINQNPGNPNKK
jgi:hypothetical protein